MGAAVAACGITVAAALGYGVDCHRLSEQKKLHAYRELDRSIEKAIAIAVATHDPDGRYF